MSASHSRLQRYLNIIYYYYNNSNNYFYFYYVGIYSFTALTTWAAVGSFSHKDKPKGTNYY